MRVAAFVSSLLLAVSVEAAEDFRVMKLEQDMRNLEREVQTLKRQLFEVQRGTPPSSPTPHSLAPRPTEDDAPWLKVANWDRLRVGMSELQVVEILGKPTALRPDPNDRRALLYTLEIGTTSFLSGAVAFDGGKVVEIQRPTLR